MKTPQSIALCGLLAAMALPTLAQTPLGTEFTYQGQLKDGGSPANGLHDLRFRLHEALEGGAQVGETICAEDVSVTNGLFTVPLDFGAQFGGEDRFLEIDVRSDAGPACAFLNPPGFVTLGPRQKLTATPYAAFAARPWVTSGADISYSAANVGIGTASPANKLSVVGNADFTGNFGIGTVTPETALHVVGPDNNGTDAGLRIDSGGQTMLLDGNEIDSNSSIGLYLNNNVPENVVLANGGGNVGIGTTSPLFPLHVNSTGERAIFGQNLASTGLTYSGYFKSFSTSGRGVLGWATAGSGETFGVYGQSASTDGRGVYGIATASSGATYGVQGLSNSTAGRGVFGQATAGSGTNSGVYGQSASTLGRGVFGWATAGSGATYGMVGQSDSTSGSGVLGWATATSGTTYGVRGQSNSTDGLGVFGAASAASGPTFGVYGQSTSTDGRGVYGVANAGSGTTYGVWGQSNSSSGFDFYAGGAGTDYGSSSSIRWKSNIEPIDGPLEKIARLRGVYFDWDAEHGGQHDVGMIAEEVGKVLPEIVNYEENGIDAIGMDYSKLTPLLVEAVNALRAEKDLQLAACRKQIKVLQDENHTLTARLERMEAMMAKYFETRNEAK